MPPCSRLQQRMRPLPVWNCADIDIESKESSVEFESVEIREFCRELGTYDDIKNGLAIGWEYQQLAPIPLDEYRKEERLKPSNKKLTEQDRGGLKRALKKLGGVQETSSEANKETGVFLPTTTSDRKKILEAFGYSKEEIKMAENNRLQKLGYSRTELIIRKAQRRVGALKRRGSR